MFYKKKKARKKMQAKEKHDMDQLENPRVLCHDDNCEPLNSKSIIENETKNQHVITTVTTLIIL
jgi:hypothetical protein